MAGEPGSLLIVGTGIRPISQTPPEALAAIQHADDVFYLAAEPLTSTWLRSINPGAQSLHGFYAAGKDRRESYTEMVECVMKPVRQGKAVCFVSYGHPGVFAYPMHQAVRIARSEGHRVEMLPGISAEDCLFADLDVDPGTTGCQSFEATDFLIRRRIFDPTSSLILWQIGVIGVNAYRAESQIWNRGGLEVLLEVLMLHYPAEHEVVIYEAAPYFWCEPKIQRTTLKEALTADVTPLSTMYVPPKEQRPLDNELLSRLRKTNIA